MSEHLLSSAIEFGSIEFVEEIRALPNLPVQSMHFLLDKANGNLPMVKYIVEELRIQLNLDSAARLGSLEVLKYLHEQHQIPISPYTFKEAVSNGHFELVKYLADRNALVIDDELCLLAARTGNVDLLKYLHERGCPLKHGPQLNIYTAAVLANSVACMKYAAENGCPLPVASHMICRAAVENNALDCLKFAREIGCEWNASDSVLGLCYIAMTVGHFDMFKYLHQNGCSLNQDFCIQAARSGRLAFMKYARKFVRWDEKVCVAAASSFSVTCLKYAHSTGLKLTSDVIREAVTCSSMECLKYAVENGCEWPSDVWALAEDADSIAMYMYITAHCPIPQKKMAKKKKKTRPPVS